ncbi:nuclear transport factor 2 family protein [Oscillatoria sp. FACHB-1406]|uniref:nuclear transport factor 2 family protein n=1 Tax=Oscillatoria sp. FACHB-1406 TaxID=2692846 RepID=UPI001683B66E|nr:nuclear transport factor 2 family protein [Oscillatoria sp. FACHB-1406]MBD2579234.1 nuclear transport factor 2 family protein [Oscillatoria sp. FACHB-1406]
MQNFRMLRQYFRRSLPLILSAGLTVGIGAVARAAEPESAPPELTAVLARVEAAANRRSLETVLSNYSPNFTTADNLSRSEFSEGLTKLWERYPDLSYRTQLQSWERRGDGLVAETITVVTGTQQSEGRTLKLESTVRSRQVIQNNLIIHQDILSERSQLSMGASPPAVEVNLPERVKPGQKYNFDTIVTKPLEDGLLLGGASEQKVNSDLFINPSQFELELLQAGGVFRMGQAPNLAEDRLLSAIIVGEGGITLVTQRLHVE